VTFSSSHYSSSSSFVFSQLVAFNQQSTYPVFNAHTTFTSMMNPTTGEYNTTVWYGNFQ
jgi:hypothetical protein